MRNSGSQGTPPTANIPSPHSLAAILSPSAPPDSDPAVGVSRSSSPKRSHAEAFSSANDPTYLHPASPKQHRPNISSVGATSPGALGASGLGADDGSSGGRSGIEEKKPAKMVRSSIACARCRRSKVKCVNNGVNSICRACESSNRECTYPSAAASTPKRTDPPMGIKVEGESDSKKRVRKHEDSGRRNSQRQGEEPLEATILTRKVWDEVYDIFKLNFSTEMPFLHPPSFRNRMRQASHPRDPTSLPDMPAFQDAKILLLGVLTLTARFHPELVAYHAPANSPRPNDPLAASDYYATALTSTIFGAAGKDLSTPTTERIQALLMLGLYEWGQTRGLSAWVYVGIATRLAQAMGLPYEDDPSARTFKPETVTTASSYRPEVNKSPARDTAIEKEVRRRTFWSCFIMDRMLSAGKARPTMVESDTLRVQLPCSDDQFLFTQSVQTGYLNRDFEKATLSNVKIQEGGVLSRYCRLVEIWGKLSKWSLHGGRRTETLPPWDESTQFYKLSHELEDFYSALPENLTFSEDNLNAHLEKRNATTYASLHTLVSLCRIMLHREYIPFIPLRADKPSGPLDEPTFPKEKFDIPEGFWEQSADSLFSSARDIVDIMRTCQDNNALPESPLFVFALFHSAFTGVYSVHFPQMDPNDYMGESRSALPIKILKDMVPRLTMAKAYHKRIEQMMKYYKVVKNEFKRYKKDVSWKGGGLDEWKVFEKDLKEFGTLEDAAGGDSHSDDYPNRNSRCSTSDLGSTTAANNPNGEPMQGVEGSGSRPPSNWAPINASNNNMSMEMQQGPGGPYIQNGAYQPSPNQNSNPPSLISPGNGDSASSINSPYSNQGQAQNYNQLQQMGQYHPPMAHQPHNMAPPGTQAGWNRDPTASILPFDAWIDDLESISMNTNTMENFTQSFNDVSQPWNVPQFGAQPQNSWVQVVERHPGAWN
ncbi:hypothetical protein BPAE_0098g00470 [Botrytis paeoniae]|uniref:Zn(2)-C6 fungal-type domain-containing protein n=1 Tax=Botrytis paeoniae TaxID=278948 RepID=A0A4Z1FMJ2_9HELO|nr:hypothetical protein BPAE_0098g00470 [Botrytis paeoniae]